MSLQRLNEHIKKITPVVCPIEHAAMGGEGFLFHRFNPRTRTCTHTRDLAQDAYCIYKGPRRFSFRGYSPFFKLGKKRASAPVLWPTISNYSASFPPFYPPRAPVLFTPSSGCVKKIRPR